MHHSGCTPRQPTPFEIASNYLTVAEGPERIGSMVGSRLAT